MLNMQTERIKQDEDTENEETTLVAGMGELRDWSDKVQSWRESIELKE